MNKSRAKTRAGKIITQPLAQSAYLSLLIAFMLIPSVCTHACTCAHAHTHTHAGKFMYSHVVLYTKTHSDQWGYTCSSKLAWAVSYLCREVHNDNYSLGLYPWINQIRHTHKFQKCQGLLWCILTEAQCLRSPVLGKWSVQPLFSIKTSWEPSKQDWEMCRANKNSSQTNKESERRHTLLGCYLTIRYCDRRALDEIAQK